MNDGNNVRRLALNTDVSSKDHVYFKPKVEPNKIPIPEDNVYS